MADEAHHLVLFGDHCAHRVSDIRRRGPHMAQKTDRITVRLPVSLIQGMDALVDVGTFRNRTEVVYHALKEFVHTQGTKAKETIEAEKGLLELKKLAAEMERLKGQFGLQ